MNDTISRQAAIDALGFYKPVSDMWTDEYEIGVYKQWQKDKKAISELPSVEPKWIPVTERMPNYQTTVIVSCIDNSGDTPFSYTACGFWVGLLPDDDPAWIIENEVNYHVVAWMPLPEPWKG